MDPKTILDTSKYIPQVMDRPHLSPPAIKPDPGNFGAVPMAAIRIPIPAETQLPTPVPPALTTAQLLVCLKRRR